MGGSWRLSRPSVIRASDGLLCAPPASSCYGPAMPTEWMRLDFSLPSGEIEKATARLYEMGIPGWEVRDESEPVVVRIWILPEDAPRITEAFEALTGGAPASASLHTDESWTRDWVPIRVGPFLITSLGAPACALGPGEHRIVLAPALAFGGGEHATTRLCLRALPDLVAPGCSVLDVGCGSGVLSVAAALLGARPVHAVDIDPTALRATQRAAEASAVWVDPQQELSKATGPYRLIVANILAPTLVELSDDLLARLEPGGRILLSGIPRGREREVALSYAPLTLLREAEEEGWTALLLGTPRAQNI